MTFFNALWTIESILQEKKVIAGKWLVPNETSNQIQQLNQIVMGNQFKKWVSDKMKNELKILTKESVSASFPLALTKKK